MKKPKARILLSTLIIAILSLSVWAATAVENTQDETSAPLPPSTPAQTNIPPKTETTEPLLASPIQNEILLRRTAYTCSYNPQTLQPNYVAWTLTPERLKGEVKREKQFREDTDLQLQIRALLEDYYNSGFDRGHLCPAADCKHSLQAMRESFLLSNTSPQTHILNAGDWEQLEKATRSWVERQGITIHIIAGPVFSNQSHRRLNRRIPVPEQFFKAIVCIQRGHQRGIAFLYTNNTEQHPMNHYTLTIDSLESLLDIDLFCSLPESLQAKIESQQNLSDWSRRKTAQRREKE